MPILANFPRPAGKGTRKLEVDTVATVGPGPHDIATALAVVEDYCVIPRNAVLAVRASAIGSTLRFWSEATATQSVTYKWSVTGKPK